MQSPMFCSPSDIETLVPFIYMPRAGLVCIFQVKLTSAIDADQKVSLVMTLLTYPLVPAALMEVFYPVV